LLVVIGVIDIYHFNVWCTSQFVSGGVKYGQAVGYDCLTVTAKVCKILNVIYHK